MRSDVDLQAEQFVAWWRKRGDDIDDAFGAWCASKDFGPRDRLAIRGEVWAMLVADGEAVVTDPEAAA